MHQISPISLPRFLKIRRKLALSYSGRVQGLDDQLGDLLNPEKNKWFEEGGSISFWVAKNNFKEIACVCAFYKSQNHKEGHFGFLECPNDETLGKDLLQVAEHWLKEQACNLIIGPVNPGQRHQYWGTLVQNFETPFWGMSYNPEYQAALLNSASYSVYYEQYTLLRKIDLALPKRLVRIHSIMKKRYSLTYKSLSDLSLEDAIECFVKVYNEAWVDLAIDKISKEEASETFDDMKDVLDPLLIWFAFSQDEAIGFFISMPNISEAIPGISSNLNLSTKFKLYWRLSNKSFKKVIGLVFGIVPSYQDKAVSAGLIIHMQESLIKRRSYENIELNWVGSFNPGMLNLVQKIGFIKHRKLLTFSKEL